MAGREQDANNGETVQQEWIKYLNEQGDWLEKTRGNLMVVATVIASMSFQVAMNPPGGVFQENACPDEPARNQTGLLNRTCTKIGGTTVLAYDSKRIPYIGLMISCTISFSASLSIILLVISGLRLRNRLVMGLLILLMLVAVLCMASTFAFSIILVRPADEMMIGWILLAYVAFWIVFPLVILVIQILRCIFKLLCFLLCCCRPRRRTHRPLSRA